MRRKRKRGNYMGKSTGAQDVPKPTKFSTQLWKSNQNLARLPKVGIKQTDSATELL